MVGHRVSQAELYDDRDVIIQILKLKDTVNDYAGGIIDSIDVVGNDLVIDWADGTSISLPLPPPTGISSIAGVVSGGNLTITIYMTDGSSHAFTTPLSGMASEAYVDAKDAQNVKLTGAQSVAGVKTFTDSPIVPTTPAGPTSAVNDVYVNDATEGVNNIVHKTGNEYVAGDKEISHILSCNVNVQPLTGTNHYLGWTKMLSMTAVNYRDYRFVITNGNVEAPTEYDICVHFTGSGIGIVRASTKSNDSSVTPSYVQIGRNVNDNKWYLFAYKNYQFGGLFVKDVCVEENGAPIDIKGSVTFLSPTGPETPGADYDNVSTATANYQYHNGVLIS